MRLSYCNYSPNSSRDAESERARAAMSRTIPENRDNANELMSQGAINIDHSRSPSAGKTSMPFLPTPAQREKERRVKRKDGGADFRNFPCYNHNGAAEEQRRRRARDSLLGASRSRKLRILFSLPDSAQEPRIQFGTI